ncbi:D-Ala-D-Ala carboxypeptidase family metallohydrolase [Massilibacteroides sp.]|uniref:D-Ala-D-Ala carboxypeptidase family metallohydrolase n=1 Tax=Massilibacteroides sp. TaxID=2034766 RepID=UPI002611DD4D|nr:D-Ala-D-Ala carboxypeptidase family metallohydrolase [Massilibacteroides sp.]MDD4515985.1 D-Ala-D-Ala carboxypeptidase family metallohydrolase [Massilibacteroides sp.]
MKTKTEFSTNYSVRLSAHFRLEEFTYSRVAIEYGIINSPPPEAIEALRCLCVRLLEPIRTHCGDCPIHILSGYRCPALNKRVGGVATSQHLKGEAADLYMVDLQPLVQLLRSPDAPEFDQAIYYRHRGFIHLSFTSSGSNRRQLIYV